MSYADRRAKVLSTNFKTFAVDATVRRPAPDDTPIETLRAEGGGLLWLTPDTEASPDGQSFSRNGAIRVAALRTSDVPTCPIGTLIQAPDERGGDNRGWRVTDFLREETEHVRVMVREDELALSA
jgi:hypothetical protein